MNRFYSTLKRAKEMLALVLAWAPDAEIVYDPELPSPSEPFIGVWDDSVGSLIKPVRSSVTDDTVGTFCIYGHVTGDNLAIQPGRPFGNNPDQNLTFIQNVQEQDAEKTGYPYNSGIKVGDFLVAIPVTQDTAEIHWAARDYTERQLPS